MVALVSMVVVERVIEMPLAAPVTRMPVPPPVILPLPPLMVTRPPAEATVVVVVTISIPLSVPAIDPPLLLIVTVVPMPPRLTPSPEVPVTVPEVLDSRKNPSMSVTPIPVPAEIRPPTLSTVTSACCLKHSGRYR